MGPGISRRIFLSGLALAPFAAAPAASIPKYATALGDNAWVSRRKGERATRDSFGDCQLHVEVALPNGRAGSGVFLPGAYEIQVPESYRKPKAWQTLDIAFRAARADEKARLSVAVDGLMIHNNADIPDVTPSGPIVLKGQSVRYRNAWVMPL